MISSRKGGPIVFATHYTELIGRTPLLELRRLEPDLPARVVAKLEFMNPMSIKDRPVLSMVKALEQEGRLGPDTEVVEASSGNTAIALAALASTMGFKATIFMSESCSKERVKILQAYGARVVLTPAIDHTRGARERGITYARETHGAIYLNQHDNDANPEAHYRTTGPEIWEDLDGEVDAVVMGIGTAGSISGLSRFFKEKNRGIRIVGFEPAASPVYSGGLQARHKLTGIGPGFVTPNFQRARERIDEILLVSDEEAYAWTARIARREGLLVGITSGAAACAACSVARRPEFKGKTIVTLFYDTGERYLSTEGLF
jgi:cysteine synthase